MKQNFECIIISPLFLKDLGTMAIDMSKVTLFSVPSQGEINIYDSEIGNLK